MDATAVVTLQRVGWADCAAQAPHGVLHSLLRSEVSAHMYGLPVVRAVIDLKWYGPTFYRHPSPCYMLCPTFRFQVHDYSGLKCICSLSPDLYLWQSTYQLWGKGNRRQHPVRSGVQRRVA